MNTDLGSVLRANDPGPYCNKCGSSLYKHISQSFREIQYKFVYCINPDCENYYKKHVKTQDC
jgi:hypothetical protein